MSNFHCQFCNKGFNTNGAKNGHEPYCKNNPNKLSAWNKGLTKETDPRVLQYGVSSSITRNDEEWKIKQPPRWNKGLTKETDLRVLQYGILGSKTKSDEEWKIKNAEMIRNNYGGLHYTQTEEYKENMKKALLNSYGVDSLMKVPEFVDKILKSRYKFKDFEFPSGEIIKVQGYEPYALKYIIENLKIKEDDIITGSKNVPEILYETDGKIRRYYCDIYIESLNLIVEVKSEHTILCDKHINALKQLAGKVLGYNHEVWLIHESGKLIERIGDLYEYYTR